VRLRNSVFWGILAALFAGFFLALFLLIRYFRSTPAAAPTPVVSPAATITPSPTLTPTVSPPPSPAPGPTGKIVYVCQVSAQANRDQICLMNADRSGFRRLTFDDNFENYYPSFSPDGNSVVYSSNRTGSYELYELDLASGKLVQLTHGIGEVAGPAISPDGRLIVFADNIGQFSRIWLMNRDGSDPHQIYALSGVDSLDPTWSPDGTRILFASGLGTDKLLYMINPDGSGLQPVGTEFRTRGRTDWSRDGSRIASYAGSPWNWNMYLMNADGTGLHQLQVGGVALAPAFSPDGQWIVFTGYLDHPGDPNGCEIYLMQLQDTRITRLTYNNYCDWQPRWGP
jgi:TolB protein